MAQEENDRAKKKNLIHIAESNIQTDVTSGDMSESQNDRLLSDLCILIDETKSTVAIAVNTGMTMLYWNVGQRINQEILKNTRADYGKEIVVTLSRQLVNEYGRGFAGKNLRRMIQFATVFQDEKIVVTLSRQLSWSHFVALLPLDKPYHREFYTEMCRIEKWSVRTLRKKINEMLFERTALSKKSDDLIKQELAELTTDDIITPNIVFRDPYFLDFLELKDRYLEKTLKMQFYPN